jgi:guanylate kinase
VSATTRQPKPHDSHAKKYEFVNEHHFQEMVEAGAFLEYAYKFENWYGTLREPVEEGLATAKSILLEIEVQGAIQVKKLFPEAFGVLILPPSEQDLLKRLRDRAREDEATIMRRFTEAQQEIRAAQSSGIYNLEVINEDQGVERTVDIIQKAIQKFRPDNQPPLF